MKVKVFGEEFDLLWQKAMSWKRKNMLLLADVHLGKVNHFRKAGIPVPTRANDKNWELLVDLVDQTKPERVVFLGDLFHSHYNEEWESLRQFVQHFRQVSFELVIGNHDILSAHQYVRNRIQVHRDTLTLDQLVFTHHPQECISESSYNICGHIHPGVQLSGKGKQAVTLPCFYFGERQGYLPAFGMFTGFVRIQPTRKDRLFVIAEEQVLKV
jgi:DNA ligase-associated metallophosphoesterase